MVPAQKLALSPAHAHQELTVRVAEHTIVKAGSRRKRWPAASLDVIARGQQRERRDGHGVGRVNRVA